MVPRQQKLKGNPEEGFEPDISPEGGSIAAASASNEQIIYMVPRQQKKGLAVMDGEDAVFNEDDGLGATPAGLTEVKNVRQSQLGREGMPTGFSVVNKAKRNAEGPGLDFSEDQGPGQQGELGPGFTSHRATATSDEDI